MGEILILIEIKKGPCGTLGNFNFNYHCLAVHRHPFF